MVSFSQIILSATFSNRDRLNSNSQNYNQRSLLATNSGDPNFTHQQSVLGKARALHILTAMIRTALKSTGVWPPSPTESQYCWWTHFKVPADRGTANKTIGNRHKGWWNWACDSSERIRRGNVADLSELSCPTCDRRTRVLQRWFI